MAVLPAEFESLVRERCRLLDAADALDPDTPLTALGVDSIEVVELVVGIETEYGLEIPGALLVPEVFVTPASIWDAISPLIAPDRAADAGAARGR